MSIPVEIEKLAAEIDGRGPGYLITTGPDGRPHTTQAWLDVDADDGAVVWAPAGRKTSRNVTACAAVAMLWPPREPGGYSLIIDGDATLVEGPPTPEGEPPDNRARVVATHAVLHRPAADRPGHDCADV